MGIRRMKNVFAVLGLITALFLFRTFRNLGESDVIRPNNSSKERSASYRPRPKSMKMNGSSFRTGQPSSSIHGSMFRYVQEHVEIFANKINITFATTHASPLLMNSSEEARFDLRDVAMKLFRTWNKNVTRIKEIKQILDDLINPNKLFATKQNLQSGSSFNYTLGQGNGVVARQLYNGFPHHSPFDHLNITSCSVVGSSGILKNSQCGKNIDKGDFVFRFNAPPLDEFASDAGVKSNITTINPISQIMWRFRGLRTPKLRQSFLNYITQYNTYIWVSAFSLPSTRTAGSLVLKTLVANKKFPVKVLFGHPEHFAAMKTFWGRVNVTGRLSTGLYMTSVAMTLCEDIHLYGFWPFGLDHSNQRINYHYYENTQANVVTTVHHFGEEFRALLTLHEEGVLRIHVGECSDP